MYTGPYIPDALMYLLEAYLITCKALHVQGEDDGLFQCLLDKGCILYTYILGISLRL